MSVSNGTFNTEFVENGAAFNTEFQQGGQNAGGGIDPAQLVKYINKAVVAYMAENPIGYATKDDVKNAVDNIEHPASGSRVRNGYLTVYADAWQGGDGEQWWQVVEVDGVTENDQVDLKFDDTQYAIFSEKKLWFYTENRNGVVTVKLQGQKPLNDYTFQITLTEVLFDE